MSVSRVMAERDLWETAMKEWKAMPVVCCERLPRPSGVNDGTTRTLTLTLGRDRELNQQREALQVERTLVGSHVERIAREVDGK